MDVPKPYRFMGLGPWMSPNPINLVKTQASCRGCCPKILDGLGARNAGICADMASLSDGSFGAAEHMNMNCPPNPRTLKTLGLWGFECPGAPGTVHTHRLGGTKVV